MFPLTIALVDTHPTSPHLDLGFLDREDLVVTRLLPTPSFLLALQADTLALSLESLVKVAHDYE